MTEGLEQQTPPADGAPPRDLWHQLGHGSWLTAALVLGSTWVTAPARAANPNATYLMNTISVAFVAAGFVFGLVAVCGFTRHRRRGLVVAGAAGVAANLALAGVDVALNPGRHVYLGPDWLPHLIQIREPQRAEISGLLIYMHGAGGTELEGLDARVGRGTFARLHDELDQRGWALVCPRGPEFEGLRALLRRRYGEVPLYLAGTSMGGRHAYLEAVAQPQVYRGVVLLCPALEEGPTAARLPPTWLVCGSADELSTSSSRLLAGLHAKDPRFHYREIADGDHGAPFWSVAWPAALGWVGVADRIDGSSGR